MRKIFMTTFCLAAVLSSSAMAIDLSAIGKDAEPKGSSVVFQNRAQSSVVKKQEAEPVEISKPAQPKKIYDGSVKIVALVNGEVITSEDMESRINAFVMSTKIPLNDQTRNMIVQRTLQAAIDERLKLQDAEKNGITISDKEIDQSVRYFENNNNIPKGQINKMLKDNRVSMDVFRTQMKSDLAWIRIIRKKVMAEGELTQKQIEEAQAEAERDLSTPKYMVSEIMIRQKNAKNLQDLVANLRQDPRFDLYAMQFSEAPSSSSGGKLGWINKERMVEPLRKILDKMKEGEISNPIKVGSDYYILKLEKIFDPKKDKAEAPTQDNIRKFLENRKMEEIAARHLQNLRQAAVIELRN